MSAIYAPSDGPRTRWGEQPNKLADALAAKIMAKATIKLPDGSVRFVIVTNLSTAYDFYFTFSAKSARSPRKKWKFVGKKEIHGYQNKTISFEDAIQSALAMVKDRDSAMITKRYPVGKKTLAQIIAKTASPVLSIPTALPAGSSVELINQRLQTKISGHALPFLRGGR